MEATLEKKEYNFWHVLAIYVSIFIYSYVFFKEPFEFYFAYLIFLFYLPKYIFKYGFSGSLLYIFLILFFAGIYNIATGNNTFDQFFKIFTGLSLSYFFFNYVIMEFDYNVDQLFKWYLKGCFIAAAIGIVQFISYKVGFKPGYNLNWLFNKWSLGEALNSTSGFRINSVFSEPTHLGTVLSAAFFVSLYNLFSKENYGLSRIESIVIITAYILSFSGLAQTGILLTLVFLAVSYGVFKYIVIFLPLGYYIFNFMYDNVIEFRSRYDSLIYLFNGGKFVLGKTHGSSFILYNNYHVATENFKSNFLFGTGLGSHPIAFEKFSLAKDIIVYGFNLNSADANSMLLRLISETGIFGVSIFMYIIFKFYVKRDKNHLSYHWLISNGILIMILLNLFRQGHYFLNGFPFFVILYVFTWYSYQTFLEGGGGLTLSNETDEEVTALPI
jgi:hypothetical protein